MIQIRSKEIVSAKAVVPKTLEERISMANGLQEENKWHHENWYINTNAINCLQSTHASPQLQISMVPTPQPKDKLTGFTFLLSTRNPLHHRERHCSRVNEFKKRFQESWRGPLRRQGQTEFKGGVEHRGVKEKRGSQGEWRIKQGDGVGE